MNITTFLKKYRRKFKLISIFIILSFILSFLIISKFNLKNLITSIKDIETILQSNHLNFFQIHINTLIIVFVCSLTIIGLIVIPASFFYELLCIFLNHYLFIKAFKMPGLIYSIIYILITKGLYLILLILIYYHIIFIIKNIIKKTLYKENLKKHLIKISLYVILIFINDVLIYIFASKILLKLIFILK